MANDYKGMTMPVHTTGVVGAAVNALNQDFIKFDAGEIMKVSVKIEQQYKKFTQAAESIKKRFDSLMGSWQGDSAEVYRTKIKELDVQSAEMAEALISFSQDLAKVSGVYKAGEAGAKQNAEALPTDGVFLV